MPTLPKVYFSYAWGDDETPQGQLRAEAADVLYQELKAREARGELLVMIDREQMGYKDRIRKFTEQYGAPSILIIMIISEKYLLSPYCMGEVVEILSNKDYRERIFPVVLPDAKLKDGIRLAQYYKEWEKRKRELKAAIDEIEDKTYAGPLIEQQKDIAEIIRIIAEFTTEMGDTLTARPPDYAPLLKALDERIAEMAMENLDIPSTTPGYAALPEFHAYTCDRVAQNESFLMTIYGEEPPPKVNWYYLYGDSRQAHESLHQRLGREIGGHLLDWERGGKDSDTKILFKYLKPNVHRIPLLYKIEVIKTLFAKFFPRISDKEPVQNKTVADLLSSPELKDFGPYDYVFVLLTMDDANWNKDVTPAFVQTFVSSFLTAALPPDAPSFFFFFGIEYTKEDTAIRREVDDAIGHRQLGGNVLPELLPVKATDVTEWFSRYRKIMVERNKEPRDMTTACFGNADTFDMKEVEIQLLELINRHNKGMAIRSDNLKRN
ncbi:MAG TPA: hypothetical protein PLL53_04275 [Saprospiraceae bacterium]|nr:hypothetical protein [Saprospiraceae bacterium]